MLMRRQMTHLSPHNHPVNESDISFSVSLQRKTVWDLFIYRSIFHQFVHPSFPSSIILSKCYLQYPFCCRRQRDALASSFVLITHSLTQSLSHQPITSWFTRTLPLSIARSFTNPLPPSLVHSFIHPFIHPFIHFFIHLPAQPPRALTISPTHFGSQLTGGSPPEKEENLRDAEKISETNVPTSSVSCRSSAPMRYVHANKKQQHTVNRTHRPLSEFRFTQRPNHPPPLHLSISIISSKCYLQNPFCCRWQRDALASSLALITPS